MHLSNLKPNQTILIKTYLHESGLFYLAKSLGDRLKSEGHHVIYVPKSKYLLQGSIFQRDYLTPTDNKLLDNETVHWFDKRYPIENQISEMIIKYKVDLLISFETLMEKSQWVSRVKQRTGIKVIDIPMVEWVNDKLLNGRSYSIFDEIWCLTEQCYSYFKIYPDAKKIIWNWVDPFLFHTVEKQDGIVRFYHAGSLNSEYSSKNTELVIQAFDLFLRESPDAILIVSGNITDKTSLRLIKKHENIFITNGVLDRKDIAKLYQDSHCVIAPSSREGLGLSLYEAKACDCLVITTDMPPMNECDTKYLCKVKNLKRDHKLTPLGIIDVKEIYEQIKQVYGDINVRCKDK